jgi:hypothetical protein
MSARIASVSQQAVIISDVKEKAMAYLRIPTTTF